MVEARPFLEGYLRETPPGAERDDVARVREMLN